MKNRIMKAIILTAAVFAATFFASVSTEAARVTVSNEMQLRQAVAQVCEEPTTIVLAADIELISNFIIPTGSNITLSSYGSEMHSLIAMRDMDVIWVQHGATLTIDNIVVNRMEGTRGEGIRVNGRLVMNSGTIQDHVQRESGSGSFGV